METVNDIVAELYRALTEADVAWFERHLHDPSVHIGVSSLHWNDGAGLIAGLRAQAAEMTGAMAATWSSRVEPVVGHHGSVAWVADRPTLCFEDGSELPCRVTLVLVRDENRWSLAHSHLSLGAEAHDTDAPDA